MVWLLFNTSVSATKNSLTLIIQYVAHMQVPLFADLRHFVAYILSRS